MRIPKRWYEPATLHRNLYMFFTYNHSATFSAQEFFYKGKRRSDDRGCLTKTIIRSKRNGHTESKSDMEAWEALVDYSKLSDLEIKIHQKHVAANRSGKLYYVDPSTGYQVMTRHAHLERGECCGNECRHCPYGRKNVPDEKRRKKFNSAFYV